MHVWVQSGCYVLTFHRLNLNALYVQIFILYIWRLQLGQLRPLTEMSVSLNPVF